MNTKKIISSLFFFCLYFSTFAQNISDGLKAMETDRVQNAHSIFKNLLHKNPENPELYYYMGEVSLKLSKKDSAKLYFNKGIALNPQHSLNYIGLGKLFLEDKNLIEAKKNFDQAIILSEGKNANVFHLIARAYIEKSQNISEAVSLLNKAIALDTKNPDLYVSLGDANLEQNNGGPALTNYEKAAELDKNFSKAYLRIGQLYIRARNFTEATNAFQSVLKVDTTYAPVYRELGELHFQAKQYDKAKEAYKKYMSMADKNVASLTRYASFLFLGKDYPATIETINEIIKMDSSNAILSRLIGYSYYEQEEYQKGMEFMERFFAKVDPQKIIGSDYEYYGKLLYKTGNDSLAAINVKKAIDLDTSKVELHSTLGDIYYHWKKFDEAAKEYNFKIINSKNPTALDYFYLGRTYYFNKEYLKADSAFTKIIELKPDAIAGYLWRGRTNNNMDTEAVGTFSAKPYYEKVIELALVDPEKNKKDLIEAYMYMGYYHVQNDDNNTAKSFYQKVLELEPNNKEAQEIVKNINKT